MSTPDVFIIESLDFSDERKQRTEGQFIAHVLKLTGIGTKYFYIRTTRELEAVLKRFDKSNYRYLHISCHGTQCKKIPIGIALTLDRLSFKELAQLLSPHIRKRRVFFSACQVATEELAEALLVGTGCYSVIGPATDIGFDEAAIYWASLYHIMLRDGDPFMKHKGLRHGVQELSRLFRVNMRYFRTSKSDGFKEVLADGRVKGKAP
jgi:hypothetical protein